MEAKFVSVNDDCFLVVGSHWISTQSIFHIDLDYGTENPVRIKLMDEHIDLDKEESTAVQKLLQDTANREEWEG